jgi:hypothetical protein
MTATVSTRKKEEQYPPRTMDAAPAGTLPLSLLPLDVVDLDEVCWNITEAHVMVDDMFLLPSL